MEQLGEIKMSKNAGRSFILERNQMIVISGFTIVDFLVFNQHNLTERFDQARTKLNDGKIYISGGDRLFSKDMWLYVDPDPASI